MQCNNATFETSAFVSRFVFSPGNHKEFGRVRNHAKKRENFVASSMDPHCR